MPKPGKYNNNRGGGGWKGQYNDHDVRSHDRGGPNKHVSFKRHSGGKGTNKDWGASLRAHLDEEDIDMGATGYNVRAKNGNKGYRKEGKRQGSPVPRFQKGKLLEGPTNWYRVTLPYGSRYDKEFILKILLEKISPDILPISWHVNGNAVIFYVDDYDMAQKIYAVDRQYKYPDGYNVIVRVFGATPNVEVTPQMREKMKLAMAKRYNADTKALDLTRFHADPELLDMFCALFKPVIFLAVVDIMAENIPDVMALKLDNNKLHVMSHLKELNKKLPNLKILHMGNNKIRYMASLDSMTGLPILDLVLDGNPLCDKFKDKDKYISEVRKRFPKVIKLDGLDLPPPISFDLEEDVPLPAPQQTFLCNQEGQAIVRQFLEQYFQIYDSDSRQSLLQAYHEHATYSMTMAYPYGMHQKNSPQLTWYATDNRNLLRVNDSERRLKLLKQGQLSVVSFLNEVPATKHDIHSFTVDLNLFTPQMLLLTVSGLFKEVRSGSKFTPIRYFFRTLVIVPAGSGFCIANEELHISNATDEQAKNAFKTIIPPVPTTSAPAATTSNVQAPPPPYVAPEMEKQQMIQAMAQHSGMNLEWSQKCLEESNWNFQKAAYVFTELHSQNVIPPEAFVK